MSTLRSGLKIGAFIGNGHFGKVYLADDPVHGRVAAKRLEIDPAETPAEWAGRKASLLKEAQNLKAADHKHVVRVHHLLEEESDDAILYVMDFCDGGSLQKSFENGPMNIAELRRVATDVAHGLDALHGRGMIHRDIKPANILRTANGTAQLGDFGLVTDNLVLGYASQAGYLDHLAPEVHAGLGTSVRTDVWAYGMTLYRLLHGERWYVQSVRPASLIPLGGFANKLRWLPHIPKKWRRAINSMMHDEPSLRCQNAREVFKALAGLPIEPAWECVVKTDYIRWERIKKDRRIVVEWKMHSDRKHEWVAKSEPTTSSGRIKTLGGSSGIVGKAQVERELQAFFESST